MQEKFWLLAGAAVLAMPALMPGRAMAADAAADAANAANAYNDADASTIIVSAPTPLSHAASDERVSIDARAIREAHAISLSDALARTAPGVAIAETQGNPLQPDLSFRGYTASPLLGTPQGIAVYVDGIRANQPFGDVVSWDLMPTIALSSSRLVTGAAPQFGRNALGGALAIETKSGLTDPGLSLAISGGSAGRARGSMEVGGHSDNGLHWYGALEGLREDGWRYASASRSWKGFAKLGWEGAHDGVALTFAHADSTLNGNGLQEYRLLAADWRSVYTTPDTTRNLSSQIALSGHTQLASGLTLSANAFWRSIVSRGVNGDLNEGALGENLYQPNAAERSALAAAGYTGYPTSGETQANTAFPKWRCIANVLLNSEPNEKCNGLLTRSTTRQQEWGGAVELAWAGRLAGMAHHLTVGASVSGARARFIQTSQFGYLLPDHSVVAVDGPGAYADGTQDSENAFDARVNLHSRMGNVGLYAVDTVAITPRLGVTLAGRFDRTDVHNRDLITPGGGTGSLDSDPVYRRFNPAASLVWDAGRGLSFNAAVGESSRAPSAVELGCSDPASPCRLPNAMAGDPPLQQVVARNVSFGARIDKPRWNLAVTLFRSDNRNDIQFITSEATGFGYFANVGTTRRQGIEVTGGGRIGRLDLSASYTLLDATYRSTLSVSGSGNSTSDAVAPGFEGNILVQPGNRLPSLPRHLFKAQARYEATKWLTARAELIASSGVYARGNENNADVPDGTYYLGSGKTDAYAVVNAGLDFKPHRAMTMFVMVRNLFNAHYATAAQLGSTGFDASGNFVARPFSSPVIDGERPVVSSTFLAPGAPRQIEVGASWHF